jgi:hypothetical protein
MMPRLGFPAVSEGPTPPRRPNLTPWLAAIGVLAVAVVAFGAVQLFDDDDDGGRSATAPAAAPTFTEVTSATPTTTPQLTLTESVPQTTPGGPEPPERAALVVRAQDFFPELEENLAPHVSQQVEGKRLRVIEVNDKASIWVGRSRQQRLLVVLNLKRQPFPEVRAGQLVDLVGQIRPNRGNHGETDPQSQALLERQGHHAFVSVQDFQVV